MHIIQVVSGKQRQQCHVLFAQLHQLLASFDPKQVQSQAELPKDELIFGAFQAGSCLGFITLYEPDAFIHYLFVSECARNQGIATALVAHCREYAQRPLTLKCLLANQSGLACYEQLGFETITVGGSECAAYACLRQKK